LRTSAETEVADESRECFVRGNICNCKSITDIPSYGLLTVLKCLY
jgi:hypothetical protein